MVFIMESDRRDSEQSPAEKQWDASRYDGGHSFVWKYGAGVIDLLAPREGERILDLGCGTGHLTREIAARGAEVIGIDRSPDMIAQAKRLYPDLRFEITDATDFQFAEPFEAVFSNAVIHWIRDQDALLASIHRALKPGGRFVAEMGGKGNLRAIKRALHRAIESAGHTVPEKASFRYFATIGEYAGLLERHGFTVAQAFYFERPTALEGGEEGLRNWIEVFADNEMSATPTDERAQIIRRIEDDLRPELYREGVWFADYRRLRIFAIKD
jgi:trans-aconitate methyltransferase